MNVTLFKRFIVPCFTTKQTTPEEFYNNNINRFPPRNQLGLVGSTNVYVYVYRQGTLWSSNLIKVMTEPMYGYNEDLIKGLITIDGLSLYISHTGIVSVRYGFDYNTVIDQCHADGKKYIDFDKFLKQQELYFTLKNKHKAAELKREKKSKLKSIGKLAVLQKTAIAYEPLASVKSEATNCFDVSVKGYPKEFSFQIRKTRAEDWENSIKSVPGMIELIKADLYRLKLG